VVVVYGELAMFANSKGAQEAPRLVKSLTGQLLRVPCLAVDDIRASFASREENRNVEHQRSSSETSFQRIIMYKL
jgi:hypothetical protein